MELHFGPRHGGHLNFQRALVIRDNDGDVLKAVVLQMTTEKDADGKDIRRGRIFATAPNPHGVPVATDLVLWSGALPMDPPPTRAFALAAELCDDNGDSSGLPLPAWAS